MPTLFSEPNIQAPFYLSLPLCLSVYSFEIGSLFGNKQMRRVLLNAHTHTRTDKLKGLVALICSAALVLFTIQHLDLCLWGHQVRGDVNLI